MDLNRWEDAIEEHFIRASGPGGQNVNKVSSAVQLRFDTRGAAGLSGEVRSRLRRIAGRRMNSSGVIIIEARRFRTRERNREDARARLLSMLESAHVRPARRVATRPSRASKERRLQSKRRRSTIKQTRGRVDRSE